MNSEIEKWIINVNKFGEPEYFKFSEGKPVWKKWKKFSECTLREKDDANARTILPNEVVIDLETKDPLVLNAVCNQILQRKLIFNAWRTGGKGYHIHLFFTDDLSVEQKKEIINVLCKGYTEYVDYSKCIERTMITLEYKPHRKTGQLKEFACGYRFNFDNLSFFDAAEQKPKKKAEDFFKPQSSLLSISCNDKDISLLELKCKAIADLIVRVDLNHTERFALMAIYLKLGDGGHKRLRQIMQRQNNYNESITKKHIETYLNKGKLLGIGCDKLKEWGVCTHDTKCKFSS